MRSEQLLGVALEMRAALDEDGLYRLYSNTCKIDEREFILSLIMSIRAEIVILDYCELGIEDDNHAIWYEEHDMLHYDQIAQIGTVQ